MKIDKIFLGFFTVAVICFTQSVYSYDVADSFRPPVGNYNVGKNNFGKCDYVIPGKCHLGDDVKANHSTKVQAIGNGEVKHAANHPLSYDKDGKERKNYGGLYIIEHKLPNGKKICSLYAHLNFSSFKKRVGDTVRKGDYLGDVGTYSQNGGWPEHLHHALKNDEFPTDWNALTCKDWIFSGYTACKSVINNWINPSDIFDTDYNRLPYRKVANVAWYPPNKSCILAERWKLQDGSGNWMSIGSNDICYSEQGSMIAELGWDGWDIIIGLENLDKIKQCKATN